MRTDLSIDCARGMGILLVVAGHAQGPWPLEKAIYSFHMPLFFMLSGYLCTPTPLFQLINKKTKTLLVPFTLTVLVSFLCFGTGSWTNPGTWWQLMKGLVTGGSDGTLSFNSPLWFLPALFTVFVLHALAICLSRSLALAALLASLGVWLASMHFPAMHILRLDTALFSYPYFLFGAFLRKLPGLGPGTTGNALPLLRGLGMAVLVVAAAWVTARILDHNAYYVLGHNKVEPLALFYFNGFSGAVMLFLFAKVVARGLTFSNHPVFNVTRKRISSLGATSFGIYLLHKPLILVLAPVLRDVFPNSLYMFIVLTALGFCAPLLILHILRRMVPTFHATLLGNRRPRPA